jgi:hypothetical protein
MRPTNLKFAAATISLVLVFAAGCASPGSPQPPSLNLPRPVDDLKAQRVGDAVQLHWTMPSVTSDGQALAGQKKATLCRRVGAGVCRQVSALSEMPKAAVEIEDALPASLLTGAPQLLTYEIEVQNTLAHSAGVSNPAYSASGPAPAPITRLHGAVTEHGVVLTWQKGAEGMEILVHRARLAAAAPVAPAKKNANPFAPKPEPELQLLRVHTDAGGTMDNGAVFGERYEYSAQRIQRLQLDGQSVEVRSEPGASIAVEVRDVFPPRVPQGTVAVAFTDETPIGGGIDLSWEANTESDLAGYYVYARDLSREGAEPVRISELLAVPAFRVERKTYGHRFAYSVSAVDKSGNESARSAEVQTTPQQ